MSAHNSTAAINIIRRRVRGATEALRNLRFFLFAINFSFRADTVLIRFCPT
jgi:hypothetical protein